jgi:ribonuclease H
MITLPIEIYSDGSSIKNPGPSAFAYIIKYFDTKDDSSAPEAHEVEFSQGFRLSTNNRMEIMGGVRGLQNAIQLIESGTLYGAKQINLFSDSEYFCNAINQKWIDKWLQNKWMTSGFKGSSPKPVKNQDLWEQVIEVRSKLQNLGVNLSVAHVKGHADNEYNNKCDELARNTSSSNPQNIDEEYERGLNTRNR